jgi:hypothetical protein
MGLFDKLKELKMDTSYDKAKTLTIVSIGLFLFAVGYFVLATLIGFGGVLGGILLVVAPIPAAITSIVGVVFSAKARREGYSETGKYTAIGVVGILLWSGIISFIVFLMIAGVSV